MTVHTAAKRVVTMYQTRHRRWPSQFMTEFDLLVKELEAELKAFHEKNSGPRTGNKGGRPTFSDAELQGYRHCTPEAAAEFLNCSVATIYRRRRLLEKSPKIANMSIDSKKDGR